MATKTETITHRLPARRRRRNVIAFRVTDAELKALEALAGKDKSVHELARARATAGLVP